MPIEIRKINRKTIEGTWYDRVLFGQKIEIQIRPRTNTVLKEIREEHKQRIDGADVYDEDAIRDANWDYLVQNFRGIEENGQPIQVNLENKKSLLFMELPPGEVPNYIWAVAKGVELGIQVREVVDTN